jgi:hypothetical protein
MKRKYGRRLQTVGRKRSAVLANAGLAVGAAGLGVASKRLKTFAGRIVKNRPKLAIRAATMLRNAVVSRRNSRVRMRKSVRGAGELSNSRARAGYRKRVTALKLQRQALALVRDRAQGMFRQNRPLTTTTSATIPDRIPGYFPMFLNDGSGGFANMPLYVADLTVYPVRDSSHTAVRQLQIADNGDPSFAQWNLQNAAGTTYAVGNWQQEYSTMGTTGQYPKYIKTDWFDMRFLLHGATTQPTWFDIMLVRFEDKWLDPLETTGSTEEINHRRAFWQGMVRNLTFNCINSGSNTFTKGLRVIRRYRKWLKPSLSNELDVTPNSHWFKLFYKDGIIRNHNWGAKGFEANADAAVQSAAFVSEAPVATDMRNNPHPRSRLWLIVRASNTAPYSSDQSNFQNTPSFDMLIRRQCRFAMEKAT